MIFVELWIAGEGAKKALAGQILQQSFGNSGVHVEALAEVLGAPRNGSIVPEEKKGFKVRDAVDLIENELVDLKLFWRAFRHFLCVSGRH